MATTNPSVYAATRPAVRCSGSMRRNNGYATELTLTNAFIGGSASDPRVMLYVESEGLSALNIRTPGRAHMATALQRNKYWQHLLGGGGRRYDVYRRILWAGSGGHICGRQSALAE